MKHEFKTKLLLITLYKKILIKRTLTFLFDFIKIALKSFKNVIEIKEMWVAKENIVDK